MDITEKTAVQIADAVTKGEVTAEAVAAAHFSRIDKLDGIVKAFLNVTKDRALAQARRIDDKRKKGQKLGALAGVPVAAVAGIAVRSPVRPDRPPSVMTS